MFSNGQKNAVFSNGQKKETAVDVFRCTSYMFLLLLLAGLSLCCTFADGSSLILTLFRKISPLQVVPCNTGLKTLLNSSSNPFFEVLTSRASPKDEVSVLSTAGD